MMSLINTGKNKGTGVRVMALMVAKHRKGMFWLGVKIKRK